RRAARREPFPWVLRCASRLVSLTESADCRTDSRAFRPMELGAAEACAQYLQKHVHPATCAETIIFSCFKQDQALDRLEFPNLAARLRQNTVQKSYRPSGSIICFRVTRFRPFRPLS